MRPDSNGVYYNCRFKSNQFDVLTGLNISRMGTICLGLTLNFTLPPCTSLLPFNFP